VPVFVDTNVLVYAVDEAEPKKQFAARAWRAALWKAHSGRLSYQVLQEFYVNAVRLRPSAREQARAEVRDLMAWRPISMNAGILEAAWKAQDRYQLSFWDAAIVAAANACSCTHLLSEDFQAGQDFGGLIVVNPFRSAPGDIENTSATS
jgi:predicted nucleic acid-binding protein